VQVWRDAGSERTHGELLDAALDPLDIDHPVTVGAGGKGRLSAHAHRRFTARGVLQTSQGRVETTVTRILDTGIRHRWAGEEDGDDHLHARWSDLQTITRRIGEQAPQVDAQTLRFSLDGSIVTREIDGKPRLTTTLAIRDAIERRRSDGGRVTTWNEARDRFDGSASYTGEVPREQRRATGHSRQQYRQHDQAGRCYQRIIGSRNGRFVEDVAGCAEDAHRTQSSKQR
jgi:hypothetical protein